MTPSGRLGARLRARGPLAVVTALYAFHFWKAVSTAVDVPFWDEWDLLAADGLGPGLSPGWLLSRHNDSVKVLTKLQFWLVARLAGGDFRVHQAVNFIIFGLVLFQAFRLARRLAPGLGSGTLACFMPFLLSPLLYENHSWGIESCMHFALLCFLSAADLLLRPAPGPAALAGGAAMALLSLGSFAAGLPLTAVLLAGFIACRQALFAQAPAPARRAGLVGTAAVAAVLAVGLAAWALSYEKPANHPPLTPPHAWAFWLFFSNLCGLGFGMDQLSMSLGLFCLAWAVVHLAPLARAPWRSPPGELGLAAVIAAILAVLAAVAATRAAAGLDWSKTSRYAEFASMLVLFGAAAWHNRLAGLPGPRRAALAGLWLLCFLGYSDDWRFGVYDRVAADRRRGLACVAAALRDGRPVRCPELYHGVLDDKLALARTLGLSFARGLPY